jgi:hypothetical protein
MDDLIRQLRALEIEFNPPASPEQIRAVEGS